MFSTARPWASSPVVTTTSLPSIHPMIWALSGLGIGCTTPPARKRWAGTYVFPLIRSEGHAITAPRGDSMHGPGSLDPKAVIAPDQDTACSPEVVQAIPAAVGSPLMVPPGQSTGPSARVPGLNTRSWAAQYTAP